MLVIVFEMAGPFAHEDDPDRFFFRHCDFCDYSVMFEKSLNESDWRQFYWMPEEGLSVCENCIPEIEIPEQVI